MKKSSLYLNYWWFYWFYGGHFEFFVLKESFKNDGSTSAQILGHYPCRPLQSKEKQTFLSKNNVFFMIAGPHTLPEISRDSRQRDIFLSLEISGLALKVEIRAYLFSLLWWWPLSLVLLWCIRFMAYIDLLYDTIAKLRYCTLYVNDMQYNTQLYYTTVTSHEQRPVFISFHLIVFQVVNNSINWIKLVVNC